MFQTFDSASSPEQGPKRLAWLRQTLENEGLDGFLVPRADAHQGEYVARRDARLEWLTGFTGSAGFCAVLADRAGIFVDGRYRVQVRAQVAEDFSPVNWPEVKLGDWLADHLTAGTKVGFDPWLHTREEIEKLEDRLDGTGIGLIRCDNLIDRVRDEVPPRPAGLVEDYPIELAGKSSVDKRADCAADLRKAGHRAAVLTLPDSICWLLNIRGSDIPRVPVVQAFAILHDDGKVQMFTDPAKFANLPPDPDIAVKEWDAFEHALSELEAPVRVDKATAPLAVSDLLHENDIAVVNGADPCVLPKARKNAVEIAGTQEAHLRDAAAMIEFLAWLDEAAPGGGLTEIDVVRKLEDFRRATNALRDISFETICGAGPNGAIVHYRVTEATNRPVKPGELLLIDSGGQYLDGTTDITRTVAVGKPGDEQRACFTRVLKGMIAISRARWPVGLAGRDLDALARIHLWQAGLDYDHGTGHGVGTYLSVHEGPQRISRASDVALEPGMILSNEPGYYREGAFGIRIENLVVVNKAGKPAGGDDRAMLDFMTLTWVPIDRTLIEPDMLDRDERHWINTYHAEITARIGDRLSQGAARWLAEAVREV